MQKYMLIGVSTLVLAGCHCLTHPDSNWDRNCKRNFSTTERELAACKEKVESKDYFNDAGTINVDPENTQRTDYEYVGKRRATDDR